MDTLITLEEIKAARDALPGVIRRTPILPLSRDSVEVGNEKLFLKAENLQVTGAYKVRAAFTMMNAIGEDRLKNGLVLASSGNFAQGFAYAGALMGVKIVVVMLDHTSLSKIKGTEGYGAEVYLCGTNAAARQEIVEQIAADRGMTAINTWEERPITLGHASIGLEIVEDCSDVEQVLVPVSSGGVAGGIAAAVKLSQPNAKVVGVQPERANAAYISLQKGEPTEIDYWETMADGLSAVRPGELPFKHLQTYLDEIILISEQEIANTFRILLTRAKILGEPAGVVASAGFLSGKVDTSLKTVAIVTGGNVTDEVIQKMLLMSA